MSHLEIGGKDKEDFATTTKRLARVFLKRFVPVTTWSRTVTRRELLDDAIGGFIVGVMVVPTCLSWASLAGLPLTCGLSAALVASFSYGTFGSCAVLSLGPVAEITTLLISIAGIAPEDRAETYQSLGVQVGLLSMILSFMDGGKVIKTVFAKAVGDGYTCAAALLAICVQLKVMFNLHVDVSPPPTLLQDVLYHTFLAFKDQATMKSIYCFMLFMTYCGYLIYIKKCGLPLWIPHQLIVVVVSTSLTAFFRLDEKLGLGVVGHVDSALSLPSFPPWHNIIGLGPYTITVTMISFVQMYVISQRVMPDLDANAELFASGMTNFLCNIFSGMPVTNSLSCSSVLLEQHVHTPFTAYVVGTILLVTILFLTKLFYFLPKQALGAIVVASVWRLLDFSGPLRLWRYSRMDAAVWVLTFLLTVFGGITIGVLSGIALSLVLIVLRIARPRAVSVGFNMKTFRYGDLQQDPELLVYPNILMWRFDAPLYFINTGYFEERLIAALKSEVRPIDVVLVTCGRVNDIDAAALATIPTSLETVSRTIKDRPVRIILTDIHGRLDKVLLESALLPIYTPEEYDGLSVGDLQKAGKKFPVVFKKLEDAIRFAQKIISEKYGNVDTAPYPNVSFLTDVVVDMTRQIERQAAVADPSTALLGTGSDGDDGVGVYVSPTIAGNDVAAEQLTELQRLKRISRFSPDRELIGVMGVVRHAELTPKQKLKITFWEPELLQAAFECGGGGGTARASSSSKRTVEQLKQLFELVARKLEAGTLEDAESWQRVRAIVESRPRGLKLQVKAIGTLEAGSFNETLATLQNTLSLEDSDGNVDGAMLIIKWGGVLTQPGVAQARVLGEKLFARFFAAGDLPLQGLVAFIHNPTIVASDESRVIDTALVVMNALTRQTTPLTKSDVKVDDTLLKTLNGPAKVLLQEEYSYFEALMHISSSAAARHFFHLPGFRELLLIPELDRPFTADLGADADGFSKDISFSHNSCIGAEMSGAFSLAAGGACRGMRSRLAALESDGEFDLLEHGANGAEKLASEACDDVFYTPIQILEELTEKLEVVSSATLPGELLEFKLSNHETLREMRARYATLLQNIRGAKRKRRAELLARRRAEHTGGHAGEYADEDGDDDSDAEEAHAKSKRVTLPSPSRRGTTGSGHASLSGTSTAKKDEDEDDDDEDGDSHDPVLRELMKDADNDGDSEQASHEMVADQSGSFEHSAHTRPPTPPSRTRASTPPPTQTSPRVDNTSELAEEATASPTGKKAAERAHSHRRSRSVPSTRGHMAPAADRTHKAKDLDRSFASPFSPSPLGPRFAKGAKRYDITDLTKLRDYASYDSSYNLPLLRTLAATTGIPSLRRVLYAFERFAHITACMATVSENILVGVNSSKRFIIGSLVSGRLLRRLQSDFRDMAKQDEQQGVKELLEKARALYMSEHSKLSEDARSVLRKVRDDICACCDSKEDEEERTRAADEAEREFRLRFPFINLPDQVTGSSPLRDATGRSSAARGASGLRQMGPSYTRFYFTSYIHVEGLLQCLYESDTVHGFLKPTKQEEEISMQNYMKHVLFKVFRRRNVSFTDDQALEAFRQLALTFRTDIPYERQQKELLRGLVQIYHSMFYVSIEVYLSLGDGAVTPKASDPGNAGAKLTSGNLLLLDTPFIGSMFDEAGGDNGAGDAAALASKASQPPSASASPRAKAPQAQQEDARLSNDGDNAEESFSYSGSSPHNAEDDDADEVSLDGGDSSSNGAHTTASTASPTAPAHVAATPLTGARVSAPEVSQLASIHPSPRPSDVPHDDDDADDSATNARLRQLTLSFAQIPRLNDSEGAGITSPSLLLTHPSGALGEASGGVLPNFIDTPGSGPHSFNSANDPVRAAAQAALSGSASRPGSVSATNATAGFSPLSGTLNAAEAVSPDHTTSLVQPTPRSPSRSPSRARHAHHHHHHHHDHRRTGEGGVGGTTLGPAGQTGLDALALPAPAAPSAGVVLTTPEAGRRTAQVQEMLYRASTVTPMRRIHEGLSLADVRQLVSEALGAALSQIQPDHAQSQEW